MTIHKCDICGTENEKDSMSFIVLNINGGSYKNNTSGKRCRNTISIPMDICDYCLKQLYNETTKYIPNFEKVEKLKEGLKSLLRDLTKTNAGGL